MDEIILLQRLKEKDETALEELMKEYESYVIRIISRILLPYMSKEDVQEAASDAFYSLWAHADAVDLQKGSIKAYLTVTARNGAKNKFRGYRGEVPLQDQDFVETDELYLRLERKERSKLIGEALECLKADEKEILVRYYYLYQNTAEIAEMMEMKVNTVKSVLRRGRKKLERHLRERGICQ